MPTVGNIDVLISGDYEPLAKDLKQAEALSQEAARSIGRAFEQTGQVMQSMGTALTAAITVPLVGMGTAALIVAGNLEQTSVAFKTLLGSTIAAQNHLEQLKQFAMSTPFEFKDLTDASKRLMALGFAADEIIPTLTAVGNAAAALGTGAVGIDRITLALGQMQSKGKVSAGEMKQLAEAGIPAWQILADAISKAEGKVVSVSETMKRSESGFIDGQMAVAALIEGMQDRFAGLMEAQAKTLLGTWSNFKDKIYFILGDIGDALAPVAKSMLAHFSDIADTVQVLVEKFTHLPLGVQQAAIAMAALAAAAGPVLYIVGSLTSAIGSILGALSSMGITMGVVSAAASALTGPLLIVSGILAGIALLHFSGITSEIGELGSVIKNNIPSASDIFTKLKEGIEGVIATEPRLAAMKGTIEAVASALSKLSIEDVGDIVFPGLRKGLQDLSSKVELVGGSYKSMATAAKLQLANLDAAHADANRTVAEGAGAYDKLAKSAKKNAGDAAAAAEAYAKKISEAFAALGVTDTKKEIKELEAAYALLAKSGKLSTEQLIDAKEQLRFKIKQLTNQIPEYIAANARAEEEIIKVLRKTREEADKTDAKFEEHWATWVKGAQKAAEAQTPIILSLKERLPEAISVAFQHTMELTDAYRRLGIVAGESGKSMSLALHDIQLLLNDANVPLEDLNVAWGKVSGAIKRVAETDLPLAMKLTDQYIQAQIDGGAAIGKIYELQAASLEMQIRQKEQLGEEATKEIVNLELLRLKQEALITSSRALGDSYVELIDAARDAWKALGSGLADLIVDGGKLSDVFKEVAEQIYSDIVHVIVEGAFKQLEAAILKNIDLFGQLGSAVKTSPVNVPGITPPGGNVNLPKPGSTPAKPDASSAAGTAGGLMDTLGNIGSIVSAISDVIGNFQFYAMNKSLDIIVKHTLQTANDLSNLRADEWEREGHLMLKLDDMWNEIRNVVDILRLIATQGGGMGGGIDAETIANLINSRPSQSGNEVAETAQAFEDLNAELGDGVEAANAYNDSIRQSTAAVAETTSGLLALNQATKVVHGSLPGAKDSMTRSEFDALKNSMAISNGFSGTQTSSVGSRMNMTPIIMPVPTPDALTGPGGYTQGAMTPHVNNPIQYPSIAPSVGGPGMARGETLAHVTVEAVDPSGRQITKATVKGLEEVGIRVR